MIDPILSYVPDGRLHDDLFLSLPSYRRVADTYYFAIDSGILDRDESEEKVRKVIESLLDQWSRALDSGSSPIFLPYDFSDQYTGCLRVLVEGDFVHVTPGFSNREGWSFSPSDISDFVLSVSDFRSDGPPLTVPRKSWMDQVVSAARIVSGDERKTAEPSATDNPDGAQRI
jgi:hypothetical protein